MEAAAHRNKIDKSTVIPLALACAFVSIAAASAWQVSGSLTTISLTSEHRADRLEEKVGDLSVQLSRLSERFDAATHDWVRRDVVMQWASLLQAQNPEMKIPEFPK